MLLLLLVILEFDFSKCHKNYLNLREHLTSSELGLSEFLPGALSATKSDGFVFLITFSQTAES